MAADETKHYLANGQETAPDAREALEWARETTAQLVDLKFCDLLGTWQHMTLPIRAFDESAFDDGLGFDGSSIRGWQGISESDMLLMPDASSAILDPFTEAPTLSLICEIADPLTRQPYAKDPRRIAKRAEEYLRSTGIADTAYMGPECEFFVFDEVLVRARPEPRALLGRLGRGPLELRQARPRLHGAREGGVLPARAARHPSRFAQPDGADARTARDPVRVPSPRGGVGRPVRDRPALPAADAHGGSDHDLQVRGQERRARGRQVGDVHAEADLRRQRVRHAHAPVALEGRHAADGGQVRLRGALAARTRVHRRPARPCAGAARDLRADDELVPAACAGLRGSRQSRLLDAQSQRVHPHPDVLRLAEGEAQSSSAARTRRRTRTSPSPRC